ncbi:MAG: sigma factor-like helix-turn-helix DNA-binding protein [Halobacteriota archaeon]
MSRQARLSTFGSQSVDLSKLSKAERQVYVAVAVNGVGVRAHARETKRSPGTVGNLLARARQKLERQP